jgi:hypothetical protein
MIGADAVFRQILDEILTDGPSSSLSKLDEPLVIKVNYKVNK